MAGKRRMCTSGIGGQAVLEGVMMKNKDLYAVAVRKPDGEIEVEQQEYHSIAHGVKFCKLPFIRGIFNFIDSMIVLIILQAFMRKRTPLRKAGWRRRLMRGRRRFSPQLQ